MPEPDHCKIQRQNDQIYCCFVFLPRRLWTMSHSLQQHGIIEAQRQLRLRMKNQHLDTIKVEVYRRAGKMKFKFTGSPEQVVKAEEVLASWA